MTRPAAKWLKRTILAALALLLLAAATVLTMLGTERGTRLLVIRAGNFAGLEFPDDSVSGTLLTGLRVAGLTWSDSERAVAIENVELELDWPGTTPFHLGVRRLQAARIAVRTLRETGPEPGPLELSMPQLPIGIRVDALTVGELELDEQGVTGIHITRLRADDRRLRVAEAEATALGISAVATGFSIGLSDGMPIAGELAWRTLDDGLSGHGRLRGSLRLLEVDHELRGDVELATTGTIELLDRVAPVFDLQNAFSHISFGDWLLRDGAVNLEGTLEAYRMQFKALASSPRLPTARVEGTATGNPDGLESLDLLAEARTAAVLAAGKITWAGERGVDLEVETRGLDPSWVAGIPAGSLDARIHVVAADLAAFTVEMRQLGGRWNDQPIAGSGVLARNGPHWRCTACRLQVGRNLVDVEGELRDQALAAEIDIRAPALHQLWPGVTGALGARGRLGGTLALPVLSGTADGTALGFREWAVLGLSVESRSSTGQDADLQVSFTGLTRAGLALGDGTLELAGNPARASLDLEWALDGWEARVGTRLAVSDDTINGTIESARVTDPHTGTWLLDSPTAFQSGPGLSRLDAAAWTNGQARIRLREFVKQGDRLALGISLADLPLSIFNGLAPSGVRAEGLVQATLDLEHGPSGWNGHADWQQHDTVLHFRSGEEAVYEGRIPLAKWSAELADSAATIRADAESEQGTTATLSASLNSLSADAELQARLRMNGTRWEWMPRLFPDIDRFTGAIDVDVRASGPLSSPGLEGEARWSDGSLAVPALNLPFTDIDMELAGSGAGDLVVSGSARSGDGGFRLQGRLTEVFSGDPAFEVELSGSSATILDWEDFRLVVSPELGFSGDSKGIVVDGAVSLDQADIVIRELPEGSVSPSADVVVDGREPPMRRRTRIAGEFEVSLGDEIHLQAFGLDTRLEGQLRFVVPEGRDPQGFGELRLVDGSFEAYGQQLEIETGTLVFTGPLDDPLVNVRAVRRIESSAGLVIAGIQTSGHASELRSRVFSEPSMAEAEALSYLLLGHPLDQATRSEGDILVNSAYAFGLRQSALIINQIAKTVGLDELSIAGSTQENTELIAGKRVSSRVYASFAYGVFSRVGLLLMRFKLTDRISIEVGAGETQSMDLLYTLEMD